MSHHEIGDWLARNLPQPNDRNGKRALAGLVVGLIFVSVCFWGVLGFIPALMFSIFGSLAALGGFYVAECAVNAVLDEMDDDQ